MNFDVCVYGGTPAGVVGAVSAARLGYSVILVEPNKYIGGMMASGLNATDAINEITNTAIAREFFVRARRVYNGNTLPVRIESKVASRIFSEMLADSNVRVLKDCRILDTVRDGLNITQAVLSTNDTITARWWFDGTYEGDLLAAGKVRFRLGREARSAFGERLAGRLATKSMLPWTNKLQFSPRIDGKLRPYVEAYDEAAVLGSADDRVQSYCIRPTLTNSVDPVMKRPITLPEGFDLSNFDLFREIARHMGNASIRSTWYRNMGLTLKSGYFNLAEIPNGKWDMNSGPLAPINNPALTKGWVTASHEERLKKAQAFRDYTQALLWFIQNDSAVPLVIRKFFSDFALPADEYPDTGHMPPMVYVREGRRLLGEDTFTQHHVENGGVGPEDGVCRGRYFLDCKPVVWRENQKGNNIVREGMFFSPQEPLTYTIPSWVMLPQRDDTVNLMSLCAVSASHVAFGSFRMEPIWMELGNIAAVVARLADDRSCLPQDIDPASIRTARDAIPTMHREYDIRKPS
ncbi:FAD-dependent oxidoreductase [Thalassorhabdomicrobium marinisediminis]|uniref:FAD-dependent oxidoreductase n=1 Tax=Thalassorhabdomicrobium marinisediminis TaxID=2170577 RepID=UPI002493C97C|nr:FAD-dependent oxidoreductase [Thalassorhabdomicrobium marinisediminis]